MAFDSAARIRDRVGQSVDAGLQKLGKVLEQPYVAHFMAAAEKGITQAIDEALARYALKTVRAGLVVPGCWIEPTLDVTAILHNRDLVCGETPGSLESDRGVAVAIKELHRRVEAEIGAVEDLRIEWRNGSLAISFDVPLQGRKRRGG